MAKFEKWLENDKFHPLHSTNPKTERELGRKLSEK